MNGDQVDPGGRGLGRLVLLGALSAFGPLSFDMYLPGLPQLARDLDASQSAAQLSLSLCMIGLGLGQLSAGPISDQIGRRRPLIAGVALFTVAGVACALTPTIELLLVVRLLAGIGGGAGAVIARAMVRDQFSGLAAARAFAVTAMVFGVAPVAAPLIGSQLMRVTGWRGVFVAMAVIGGVLLVAAARTPETLAPADRHTGGLATMLDSARKVLRDRAFLAPAVTLALGFTPLSLYLAMSSFALQGGYGLSPQQFGYVFAVNSVGILAVGRVNLRLVTRLGPRRLLGCGLAISVTACATVCAAALTGAPLVAVLAPLFVAISCVGLLLPNGTTLAMSAQSAAVGSAAALLGLIQSVINAGLAPLISLLGVTPAVLGTSMLLSALAGVVPFLAIPRAAR